MDLSFEITEEQIAEAKIVVVDDEELVTASLCNYLLLDLDVEAVSFNKPLEALKHLQSNPVDLIISDFLMPELDGVQLPAGARNAQTDAPRVLLPGYADKEHAIKAINEVQLYQYVEKPWENEQLKQVIKSGLERKWLIQTITTYVEKLAETESDLKRVRNGLRRAFA